MAYVVEKVVTYFDEVCDDFKREILCSRSCFSGYDIFHAIDDIVTDNGKCVSQFHCCSDVDYSLYLRMRLNNGGVALPYGFFCISIFNTDTWCSESFLSGGIYYVCVPRVWDQRESLGFRIDVRSMKCHLQ